ncbi:hypothetical protein GCM10028804_59810 [Larkinella terrae]
MTEVIITDEAGNVIPPEIHNVTFENQAIKSPKIGLRPGRYNLKIRESPIPEISIQIKISSKYRLVRWFNDLIEKLWQL